MRIFWKAYKLILEGNSARFGGKWPKIWPTCIFMSGKSLDGLKRDFGGEKKIRPNLVENGRKYGQHVFSGGVDSPTSPAFPRPILPHYPVPTGR